MPGVINITGRAGVYGNGGLMPRPVVDRKYPRTNNGLVRGPIEVLPTTGLEVDLAANLAADKSIYYPHNMDWNTASAGMCVIPKGNMIAFNNNGMIDFANFAEAASQRAYPVGMNVLNLMAKVPDRLAGNRPVIANRGYFELPIFAYSNIASMETNRFRWGAVLAYNGAIQPGDMLRCCGYRSNGYYDGNHPGAQGWLTNANTSGSNNVPNGKLLPTTAFGPGGAMARVIEVILGPTFEGMLEWVQFDNPWEFEESNEQIMPGVSNPPSGDLLTNGMGDLYHQPDTTDVNGNPLHGQFSDPNSNVLFRPGGNAFSHYLQYPNLHDAMGIPNLTDGANWQTWQKDTITLNLSATDTSATFPLYYYKFWGVGGALNAAGTGAISAASDLLTTPAPLASNPNYAVPSVALLTYLHTLAGSIFDTGTSISLVDDGYGTILVTISGMTAPGVATQVVFDVYFNAVGQAAGIPTMLDNAFCIGMARFQLMG